MAKCVKCSEIHLDEKDSVNTKNHYYHLQYRSEININLISRILYFVSIFVELRELLHGAVPSCVSQQYKPVGGHFSISH